MSGFGIPRSIAIAACLIACAGAAACHRPTAATRANCLIDVKLTDACGNPFSLASLKGKPVVVNFIYTSCPGACLMETSKLAIVGRSLGSDFGPKVAIVSITVDPGHDGPLQLRDYARKRGADQKGWYFVTGSPPNIDLALAGFSLRREVEPDGSIGHMVNMILVGADGRAAHEYNGEEVKPQAIVEDVRKILATGTAGGNA